MNEITTITNLRQMSVWKTYRSMYIYIFRRTYNHTIIVMLLRHTSSTHGAKPVCVCVNRRPRLSLPRAHTIFIYTHTRAQKLADLYRGCVTTTTTTISHDDMRWGSAKSASSRRPRRNWSNRGRRAVIQRWDNVLWRNDESRRSNRRSSRMFWRSARTFDQIVFDLTFRR